VHKLALEAYCTDWYIQDMSSSMTVTPVRSASPQRLHGLQPVSAPPALRPQYSLAHLTLLHKSPPELTEIAARAGYDFVSFRPIGMSNPGEPMYPLACDAQLLRRTRAALSTTGMRVLDIELARILADADVARYHPALECSAELGARHVLTSAWCSDRSLVLEQFIKLCEIARPLGLTVDFEFVTFAPFGTLQQAVDIVAASGCSNAGLCIDTLHFDRSGHRPEQLVGLPRAWFHYAQICDGPRYWSAEVEQLKYVAREARLYVGQGGINVPGILDSMPPVPRSIELPNSRLEQELGAEEFARRCLQTAKAALDFTATNQLHG
jgi:sugar phosphate isomerase/epimerase